MSVKHKGSNKDNSKMRKQETGKCNRVKMEKGERKLMEKYGRKLKTKKGRCMTKIIQRREKGNSKMRQSKIWEKDDIWKKMEDE